MRKFFPLIVSIALLLFSCSRISKENGDNTSIRMETYENGNYRIEMSYPESPVLYGSTFEIRFLLKYPAGEKYLLLPVEDGRGGEGDNIVILGIEEGEPVIAESAIVETEITIRAEAYLPGLMVFPPVTVSFAKDITTDEISIEAESGFGEERGEQEEKLAPVYIPENNPGLFNPVVSLVVLVAVFAVAAVIIFIKRRAGKKSERKKTVKTKEEILSDFRKEFLDTGRECNLREAFAELEKITEITPDPQITLNKLERYREVINKARFSRDGIAGEAGKETLKMIFDDLFGGVTDDF